MAKLKVVMLFKVYLKPDFLRWYKYATNLKVTWWSSSHSDRLLRTENPGLVTFQADTCWVLIKSNFTERLMDENAKYHFLLDDKRKSLFKVIMEYTLIKDRSWIAADSGFGSLGNCPKPVVFQGFYFYNKLTDLVGSS